MPDNPTPKVGGKKLPKSFWIIGIGAAVVIGLYLRSRSNSSGASAQTSQQTGTPSDITSNPYYYTASGAYPDTSVPYYDYYGSSPYGASSLAGNYGLPSGFDPTSFEEGITYAQQSIGGGTSSPVGSAPVSTPVGNLGSPGVTINLTNPTTRAHVTPGKPAVSGRRKTTATQHVRQTKHKPAPKKKGKR